MQKTMQNKTITVKTADITAISKTFQLRRLVCTTVSTDTDIAVSVDDWSTGLEVVDLSLVELKQVS